MKKLLSLLLALVATTSLWAQTFQVGNLYYYIASGTTVEVIKSGDYYDLTTATIPSTVTYNGTTYSVTSIGSYAFSDCSSLTSITIPNSVTSIGIYAFAWCTSLTSVTIPNSVTSIGGSAFSGTGIHNDESNWENNVLYIDDCLIEAKNSISGAYTIKENTRLIGTDAFHGCHSLTSITIPNSVTSIGNWAFAYCSSLSSITIPNSVTSIGSSAFSLCSSLTSMVVESGNTKYDSRENCNAIIETATNTLIAGCQNSTIPNSVTSIGSGAFQYCSSLTSVTIPNSVTSIGSGAFQYCSSLTSVTIPNSVTSIGGWAFYDCSSLTSITIPNSVTSIGIYAFSYCSSLTSITIGNSVTSIGENVFYYCSSLTSITIPNSVTSIGYRAFSGCESLTSITCEAETPPTVGRNAFEDVLTSIPVNVPCGCVSTYRAADGWDEFTNIQEPQVEYSIEVYVNDTIMGSAKVDYNTFCEGNQISATPNLGYHLVQWSDGNTDNPRTLVLTQDTVLTAEFALTIAGQCGDNLYWDYDKTNQTISITGSGDMYDYTAETQPWVFFKEEIKEITISNTATSIGTSAFEGSIRLSKVSIGTAMVNIGAKAFAGCTKLYDIYCLAAEPPTGYTSSFANYNAFLHVPCESQRLYMLDILFGEFKYIECIASDEVPTDDIVITPGSTDVTITWPTKEGADTYTIVIKKGNEVFCTLTFNADGQLLNIAFAPGRNGNHPVQYAEQAANGKGFRFTVTGLEDGTDYTYDITVKNEANQVIKTHSGKFTTESLTAVENTHIQSPMTNCQKIFRNGQLIILRDEVEYNAQGQIIKE